MNESVGSLSVFSPLEIPRLAANFGWIMLRYVFADGTEFHLYMHELFLVDINKLLEVAIKIHGPARIEEPRPGRFV